MQCQQCGHKNKQERRYCAICGETLSVVCVECGFANDPEDSFCGGCGEPVSLSSDRGSTPNKDTSSDDLVVTTAGELRQVTILFADIAGYTRLSSERDPEEIHHLLSRFFEFTDGIVQSYGGRIDKHIGDAVMGVFGAPVAHGNDPERAVRAAVDIHESMKDLSSEIGIDLRVHIGIASGQVVASGLGSTAHQEYTVTGNSVNLAARLVGLANSNETLISDSVHFAIQKYVDAEQVGDVMVKGLSKPVKLWRLISIADTLLKAEKRSIVGRKSELRQFRGMLETCNETGTGNVLYVRGEAGIGKTRLVEEFSNLAEAEGFECHTGHVLDFGIGKGQDVIRSIVRSLLDLTAGSDLEERAKAVRSVLSNNFLETAQLVFLNNLLDVPQDSHLHAMYDAMDNETRNKGKQEAVSTLMQRMSRARPLIVTAEDLHWADQLTLAYLSRLCSSVSSYPITLVMTSRLEGDPLEHIKRYASGTMTLTTIDLGALGEDECLEFASEFFDLSNRFAQDCVQRAEGNPLFLEQLLLSIKNDKSENIPGSVQSIVLARIDHLSINNKRAIQAASVLGQRFSLDVLRYLIDNSEYDPEDLIMHYLIRPTEGDYIFAHALVWESVYSSLLRVRRTELHEQAATWFSKRDSLLYAEHLERAGNPAAANAYIEAVRSQMQLFHFEDALQSIDRGIAVATQKGDNYNLLMLKGECFRELGQPTDSIEVYQTALETSPSDVDKCRAWIGLAAGMRVTDNFDDAFSALSDAEDVARSSELPLELSQIHYYRGNLYFPLGNIEGCLEQHELALESAQQAQSPECEARAMSGLGDAYYSRGEMVTALKYFRRCIELCRKHGFGRIEVENRYMVAWNRLYLNEVRESLEDAEEAIKSAVQVEQKRAEMVARLTAARTLCEMSDHDAAEIHIVQSLEIADHLGANRFKAFISILYAQVQFWRGGFQQSTVDLMRNALEISRSTGIGFVGPWVLSTLALVIDEEKSSLAVLDEGEEILNSGCVGHNYFDFYRNAMEVAWRYSDWDLIERYADALHDFIKPEPLPWAEHYIKWGRALAAHGRTPSAHTAEELHFVKTEAQRLNLLSGVQTLEQALTNH